MSEELVDCIYECAFAPELWPGVFDALARMTDARGGHLFTSTADWQVLNWTSSASLHDGMTFFAGSNFFARSARGPRLLAAKHAGFLREVDVYTDEQLAADPMYPEFLWPAGLGSCAATAIPSPTGEMLFLSLERDLSRGPVDAATVQKLDALRPHLARSALMAARLQLERAKIASETLASIGLPALVFDRQGKVLAANHLIETMDDHLRWRAQDRMSLKDAGADALFRQAVETLHLESASPPRSFAVRSPDAKAAAVAHVIPIRRSVRDIFAQCAGVLVLTPATLPQAPSVELIQSLFDLSPAEARVARSMVAGQTVEEIATSGQVSVSTVRTQVRGVLEKTGSRRQADAIALLGGISNLGK